MRKTFLFLSSLIVLPIDSRAAEVRFRSGEHDTFTRLAFDLDGETTWSVSRIEENNFLIKFNSAPQDFDFSSFRKKLNAGRVGDVSVLLGNTAVSIDLNCNCDIDSSLSNARMGVIDIKEKSTEITNMPDAEIDTTEEITTEKTSVPPEIIHSEKLDPSYTPPRFGSQRGALDPTYEPTPQFRPVQYAIPQPDETQELPLDQLAPSLFGGILAEQLAEAATKGLLDPTIQFQASTLEGLQISEKSEIKGQKVTNQAAQEDFLHSNVASQLDTSVGKSLIRFGEDFCEKDDNLSVSEWGGENAINDLIPQLRADLFSEFDRLDEATLLRLVKAYIHVGFGMEARALMEMLSGGPDPVLSALAMIVDGQPDRAGVFVGQAHCPGHAAMWALAGSTELPEGTTINSASVRRSFDQIPLDLRLQLGPKLATRLAEEGRINEARTLLSQLARATGDETQNMRYVSALIDGLEGQEKQAENTLNGIARSASEYSPEAITAAIDIATKQGQGVDQRVADLSTSYSVDYRDTEIGADLWLSSIRASSLNGKYETALKHLTNDDRHPSDIKRQAASDLVKLLLKDENDQAFLQVIFNHEEIFHDFSSTENALGVARRLLALGLADQAEKWLHFEGVDRNNRDVKLLLSEIYLTKGEPEMALVRASGLRGDDALKLRAEAYQLMGNFNSAGLLWDELGDVERKTAADWLSGNWQTLTNDESVRGEFSRLAQEELPNISENFPSIDISNTLSSSSRDAINSLRSLLNSRLELRE
ncbi:hypothetical protein GCM10011415_29590 [Salipiger pallidus]|uniref:Uncharacterized protein n=1 Tax=Salipiger pallidus TaxID=1775170 RepID=A0A8J3EH89_9RHOB|nr:hypothetical protein [Salipiger pallidus]GGG78651.1 hypothetical protein GCM10011415_29590 [Salipiger pallidus]